jgi:predicted RNase H-like HicB family nuclease
MRVTANAQRSGGWWAVEVPAIPGLLTQAKRLDQVESMVKEAAELLGAGDVDVDVVPQLPADVREEIQAARQVHAQVISLQERAAAKYREVAARLRREGLTVRDVAAVLEVSPQRVSQLVPAAAAAKAPRKAAAHATPKWAAASAGSRQANRRSAAVAAKQPSSKAPGRKVSAEATTPRP